KHKPVIGQERLTHCFARVKVTPFTIEERVIPQAAAAGIEARQIHPGHEALDEFPNRRIHRRIFYVQKFLPRDVGRLQGDDVSVYHVFILSLVFLFAAVSPLLLRYSLAITPSSKASIPPVPTRQATDNAPSASAKSSLVGSSSRMTSNPATVLLFP